MATFTRFIAVDPSTGIPSSPVAGDSISFSVTNSTLTTTNANTVIVADSTDGCYVLKDNDTPAKNYIYLDTTGAAEHLDFGNASTNPDTNFLGTGLVKIWGDLEVVGTITFGSISVIDLTYSGNIHGTKNTSHTIDINVSDTGHAGGNLTIRAGQGDTGKAGGNLVLGGGAAGAGSTDGWISVLSDITFTEGATRTISVAQSTGGAGNDLNITGAAAKSGGAAAGGHVAIQGGTGDGALAGGHVSLIGGVAGATGTGGEVVITGGSAAAGHGGGVNIDGGVSTTTSHGGDITLDGGVGEASGGAVLLTGGKCDGATKEGPGGNVTLQGGDAATSSATGQNGGTITIDSGSPTMTGTSAVNIGASKALAIGIGRAASSTTMDGVLIRLKALDAITVNYGGVSDAALAAGDVVMTTATGWAKANATSQGVLVFGVVAETIGNGSAVLGSITAFGFAKATVEAGHASMAIGDKVYLSKTTAGTVTATPPGSGTVHLVGVVTKAWTTGSGIPAELALKLQFLYNI